MMCSQPVIEIVPQISNCISQSFSPFLLKLTLSVQAALLLLCLAGHFKHVLNLSHSFLEKSLPYHYIFQVQFNSSQTLSHYISSLLFHLHV